MDRSTLEIFFIIDRRRDTTIHFKVVFLRPLFLQAAEEKKILRVLILKLQEKLIDLNLNHKHF